MLAAVMACSGTDSGAEPTPRPPTQDLHQYLEVVRADYGLPSLAVARLTGAQVELLAAVGVRKNGDATPVSVDDPYHLGSDTKAMTATLVADFVEEGLLSWETTMQQALPDLSIHPDYAAVTIEELLRHQSGAPRDVSYARGRSAADVAAQRRELAAALLRRAPAHRRGKNVYSNAGYVVVGAILEARSNRTWEDLMRERIFEPLGMTSCGFGAPGQGGAIDVPYGHRGKRPVMPGPEADNPPILGPAGTVHCSLRDWSSFARVHLQGARGETGFLQHATFLRLHTGVEANGVRVALGWGVTDTVLGPGLVHYGSNGSWFAGLYIVPSHNVAVLAATNMGGDRANDALVEVLEALLTHSRESDSAPQQPDEPNADLHGT